MLPLLAAFFREVASAALFVEVLEDAALSFFVVGWSLRWAEAGIGRARRPSTAAADKTLCMLGLHKDY
jgi:hypothetical protein